MLLGVKMIQASTQTGLLLRRLTPIEHGSNENYMPRLFPQVGNFSLTKFQLLSRRSRQSIRKIRLDKYPDTAF